MDQDEAAPGAARAGAAFAKRRKQIGVSQSELGRRKIITQPNLSKFERGLSWPRERTRAQLEQAVNWPPGTISVIAGGGEVPGETIYPSAGAPEESPRGTDADLATQIGPLIGMAMGQVDMAIDALPAPDDAGFASSAEVVRADLRKLEAVAVRAVRSGGAATPAAARMLARMAREVLQPGLW